MNLNLLLAVAALGIILLLVVGMGYMHRMRPRTLNVEYYQNRWKELQKLCGDKATWPLAIIDADKLLDEALRQNKIKGKTMGERLVAVQRSLTNNDSVWYAHKLRNKLVHEHYDGLKERDVKEALMGFRQALKDLGALR